MNVKEDLDKLLANLPHNAKIVIKGGWFWNSLAFIVKIITLGKNSNFGKEYITTIGRIIAVPVSIWDERNTDPFSFWWIINHELTHVKQVLDCGFGNYYLGLFVFAITYLLLPLPFGVAWYRYKYESEAYVAGFKASIPYFDSVDSARTEMQKEIESVTIQLTSGLYGWTMGVFPGWVRKDLTARFIQAFNDN